MFVKKSQGPSRKTTLGKPDPKELRKTLRQSTEVSSVGWWSEEPEIKGMSVTLSSAETPQRGG